jgi:hypothetical protein
MWCKIKINECSEPKPISKGTVTDQPSSLSALGLISLLFLRFLLFPASFVLISPPLFAESSALSSRKVHTPDQTTVSAPVSPVSLIRPSEPQNPRLKPQPPPRRLLSSAPVDPPNSNSGPQNHKIRGFRPCSRDKFHSSLGSHNSRTKSSGNSTSRLCPVSLPFICCLCSAFPLLPLFSLSRCFQLQFRFPVPALVPRLEPDQGQPTTAQNQIRDRQGPCIFLLQISKIIQ